MPLMGLKTDKLYLPWTRITEVPAGVGGDPNWANVQGKPTTLAGFGLAAEVAAAGSGLGYGQTWRDVKAVRQKNVTYYNTTGKPILVSSGWIQVSGSSPSTKVDGVFVELGGWVTVGQQAIVSCLVPPGSSYTVETGAEPTLLFWSELRGD